MFCCLLCRCDVSRCASLPFLARVNSGWRFSEGQTHRQHFRPSLECAKAKHVKNLVMERTRNTVKSVCCSHDVWCTIFMYSHKPWLVFVIHLKKRHFFYELPNSTQRQSISASADLLQPRADNYTNFPNSNIDLLLSIWTLEQTFFASSLHLCTCLFVTLSYHGLHCPVLNVTLHFNVFRNRVFFI